MLSFIEGMPFKQGGVPCPWALPHQTFRAVLYLCTDVPHWEVRCLWCNHVIFSRHLDWAFPTTEVWPIQLDMVLDVYFVSSTRRMSSPRSTSHKVLQRQSGNLASTVYGKTATKKKRTDIFWSQAFTICLVNKSMTVSESPVRVRTAWLPTSACLVSGQSWASVWRNPNLIRVHIPSTKVRPLTMQNRWNYCKRMVLSLYLWSTRDGTIMWILQETPSTVPECIWATSWEDWLQ